MVEFNIKNILGSDLTGSDTDTGRTYTIPDNDYLTGTTEITLNGTSLHEGASNDFTVSGRIVTFVGAVSDTDVIKLTYYTTNISVEVGSSTYATQLQVAQVSGVGTDYIVIANNMLYPNGTEGLNGSGGDNGSVVNNIVS